MKNKGFTLVELLAILGVLAVITLITVPIIDSIIKKNKEKLYNSQINSINASLKTWGDDNIEYLPEDENDPLYVTLGRLKYDGFVDIDIKNPKTKKCFPNNMLLTIKKTCNGYEYFVDAESGDEKADDCSIPTTSGDAENVGDIVYYNPVENCLCSDYSESNSQTGVKEGCMKWYLIENRSGKKKVSVILDHNTTAKVAWNSSGNNADGMNEVATALANDTQGWQGSPRLITANEVARITGNTGFDASQTGMSWFCLDTNVPDSSTWCAKAQGTSAYKWLFNNTTGCTDYGCDANSAEKTDGYWTSTPYASDTTRAWGVDWNGTLYSGRVGNDDYYGVRPVITISLPLNR